MDAASHTTASNPVHVSHTISTTKISTKMASPPESVGLVQGQGTGGGVQQPPSRPKMVGKFSMPEEAVRIMRNRCISELPC